MFFPPIFKKSKFTQKQQNHKISIKLETHAGRVFTPG
jgi:hypothetical protein